MTLKWWGRGLLLIGLLSARIHAQDTPVTIRWFVGLGSGNLPEHIEIEQKITADFNNSQTAIRLEFMCGCDYGSTANSVMRTLIDAGTPPDIVGPVGITASNEFVDEWLDLQPLVDKAGYDLSQFPIHEIDSYRSQEKLIALPFAIFPGVLYYNADLFDAAGLNYPPSVPGDPYIMPDGRAVPWNYDTVAAIAPLLTLDARGHTATSPDFDPDTIVQFGFMHQWDEARSDFHTFGAAAIVDKNNQVMIPDNWRAQAHWMWEGIWKYHFMPTDAQASGPLFQFEYVNPFASGHVAMNRGMLWYTCCIADLKAHWDLAVQPAYKGQIYAPMDMDSFYIPKGTPHPEEAFTVLQYLLGRAAPDLLTAYDAFPARPDLQPAALAEKAKQFPQVQHWEVVTASASLAPIPHHDAWYPNFQKGQTILASFLAKLRSDTGGTLDLDAELDQLKSDLQAIIAISLK